MQTPHSLVRKTLAALLSFELAVGGVPARAWAEGLDDLQLAEEPVAELVVDEGAPDAVDETVDVLEPALDAAPGGEAVEDLASDEEATEDVAEQDAEDSDPQPQEDAAQVAAEDVEADVAAQQVVEPEALAVPEDAVVSVSAAVVGIDAQGEHQVWVARKAYELPEGSTVEDLTKQMLDGSGLAYEGSTRQYGWSLDCITSTDGRALASDPQTWDYWQLFVDGTSSELGASSVTLTEGMSVTWYYSGWGQALPDEQSVTATCEIVGPDEAADAEIDIDPTAERPSFEAEWSGYKGTDLSGTAAADAPTDGAELLWSAPLLPTGKQFANVSDPILVNGSIYIVADAVLHQLDAATGAEKAQAPLAGTVSYTSRIRYADGLVLVPLEGGRVQAITADKLVTVWLSDEVPELPGWGGALVPQQNSSTIITHNGYAYLGTTDGVGSGGNLLCLSLETGATRWSHASSTGYYWAGCAMTDAGLVVVDDGGTLSLIDALSGTVKATLALAAGSRANVVAADGSTVYVVTKDGVLRKVTVGESSLSEAANVKFASSSTTTPTIAGNRIVVAGVSESYTGVLGLVDPTTMQVVQTVTKAGDANIPGDIKSAPLVVTTSDGSYAYFTANNLPGSVYVYKLGEALAAELFKPASGAQNYCMSSVIVGANGVLYYTNDSATLFALKAAEATDDNKQDDGKQDDDNKQDDDSKQDDGKQDDGKKQDTGKKQDDAKQDQQQKPDGATSGGTRTAYIQVRSNTLGTGPASSSPTRATAATTATDKQTSAKDKGDKDVADKTDAAQQGDEDEVVEVAPYDGDLVEKAPDQSGDTPAQQAEQPAGKLPIWPIVGMALGSVVLLLAIFGRRRDDDEDEE